MATQEQIEALRIDENIFELAEDTELEYLVHFAASFTGQTSVWFPKERPLHHIHRCEAMPCICNSKHSHSNIAMVVQHDFWKFPRFTSYCLCFMAVLRKRTLSWTSQATRGRAAWKESSKIPRLLQPFSVPLALPKLLTLGKAQIYLAFHSFFRTFAPK